MSGGYWAHFIQYDPGPGSGHPRGTTIVAAMPSREELTVDQWAQIVAMEIRRMHPKARDLCLMRRWIAETYPLELVREISDTIS